MPVIVYIALLLALLPIHQQENSSFRFDAPEFVKEYHPYELALTTSHAFDSTLTVTWMLQADRYPDIRDAELRTANETYPLEFEKRWSRELEADVLAATFHTDMISLLPNQLYQVHLTLRADGADGITLRASALVRADNHRAELLPWDDDPWEQSDPFIERTIRYYRPQSRAGRMLTLTESSSLSLKLPEAAEENEPLVAEWWFRADEAGGVIAALAEDKFDESLPHLHINENQVLAIANLPVDVNYFRPQFIALENWYHLMLRLDREEQEAELFIDGHAVTGFSTAGLPELKKIIIGGYRGALDLLRVWQGEGSLQPLHGQRNYLAASRDSLALKAQYTFDQSQSLIDDTAPLYGEQVSYRRSDAPVFSSAPDLNITMLPQAFMLEWQGGDYTHAAEYTLQKSVDGGEFQSLHTTWADRSEERKYTFMDEADETDRVVYYRIKQLNRDSSIVYSPQTKIGQGSFENFILHDNFPNPFNPATTIKVEMLEDAHAELTVHNLEGKLIATLHSGMLSAGLHEFPFNAFDLTSGIYLYTLTTAGGSQTHKMILAK